VAEIVKGVYGADTVTANYVQFLFRRFRSGISDVKDASRTGRPVVENVVRHVSSRSIAQKLKIDHKTVLNHLRKVGIKKSSIEALAKRNEIDRFLKRMVTADEKWATYDNIVRKRSGSKRGEAALMVTKPGLTAGMLDHLKLAIDQKRPELAIRRGVVFYQDNARPLTSIVTRQKLWKLGW
ncbi:UNVERIFIED_CONTAM: Histone-lysine N-methyltransferase SETMAR, partial [Trichonephila clavipes]